MEKIKLLLYCTKQPSYLYDFRNITGMFDCYKDKQAHFDNFILNGKIVAECDFEVEEISRVKDVYDDDYFYDTPTLYYDELLKKSCLNNNQLEDYLEFNGYAIHIKNLKERVMELSDVYTYDHSYDNMFGWIAEESQKYIPLKKAPQNMCRVWVYENGKWVMYILISVRPEWMCLILNKDKDVEVRKRVLKGMLEYGK